VALTEAGQELYLEHHAHHLHLTREIQAALTPEETELFASILTKLTQAL
jgi:DNA-binding MarR family transcriptional regulator